jgi:hypothetical protein
VGVPGEWHTLIHRDEVVVTTMTGQMPSGAGGPPTGGEPPTDKGPRGGALGAP